MPTSKSRAEYMAARRAELKKIAEGKTIVPPTDEEVEKARQDTRVRDLRPDRSQRVDPATGEVIEKRSGYRMLPGDDWVQKLTQHQRDEILNHPAIKTAKRG